ncbi:hypothetical protein O181_030296 [Austropuccinia psidii MF-1]|uniref:RNA-directed DNA polymerase n=1 Tax=Austropuccinia psidii MF-1 TaxID=1389203 RepID=A0A9Q3CY80_9BASI|nr:hypothetical protein [Austropuccinia psidii MF-1]
MSELPENIPIFILDSNESPAFFITHYTKWVVDFPSLPSFEWDFFIIDSPKGEDLILGYDFLYHFNPIIDWKNGYLTYDSIHKDSGGIKSSASNDLATAVNIVALVGEIKTPALPSVHIPSIMPSQSLLKSRDEIFKDIKDLDEEEQPEEIETVLKVVPPAYHQYLDVFSKVKAAKRPPHCACDHHIEFKGLLPPVGVIYSLSNQESEILQEYISENVEKGFIRQSSSSTGPSVLFVKKKDGDLCLCVDYCKLNAFTRKNRYPVPPMNKSLTVFNGSTIFSKIDLCGAYNLLRIQEGDQHLTAFRTKYGTYEYLVIPFGLTNAPASFQNIGSDIFVDFLDVFVVVYLGDSMFFSSSEEEHAKHLASVLQRLRDNSFFAKASKCIFHASSVEYLGYVVSSDGLKMDSPKVQQILHWPQPKNIKAVQSFIGFANFYCRLIRNYSKKITALTFLLKKDSPFIFNEEARKTDSYDYALGAVLSQVKYSGKHPIAFDICKLFPAELNYEIHNKELLGIVWALKRWRAFLLSLCNSFEVLTDHSSLQYFMYSKILTHCQARWPEFLSEFYFTITYCPGWLVTLPDALSRWDKVYQERGVDSISKNPQNFHQVIKQDAIQESRLF